MRKPLFAFASVLVACGGSSQQPAKSTSTAATTTASAAPAQQPSGPFDRNAARAALDAIDANDCMALVPKTMIEQPLHVRVTFDQSGHAMDVSADGAFAGTPAGKCAEDKYKGVRVSPFVGPLTTLGKSVTSIKEQGDPSAPPFDPAVVRAEVAKIDLSECATLIGDMDRGKARIAVRPNGEIRSVIIDGDINGTMRGDCVQRILRTSVHGRAYSGEQAPGVDVDFVIHAPKK
ncbi:MAG TPA: hypothetical protein VIF62_11535 [Labilithrix sp.]